MAGLETTSTQLLQYKIYHLKSTPTVVKNAS